MERIEIHVHGKVQGVGYRAVTKHVAKKMGIVGFVQNRHDYVHVVAEGEKDELMMLVNFCKKGPEFAEVEHVHFCFYPATKEFKEFSVKVT